MSVEDRLMSGGDRHKIGGDRHISGGDRQMSGCDRQMSGGDIHMSGSVSRQTRRLAIQNFPKMYCRCQTAPDASACRLSVTDRFF